MLVWFLSQRTYFGLAQTPYVPHGLRVPTLGESFSSNPADVCDLSHESFAFVLFLVPLLLAVLRAQSEPDGIQILAIFARASVGLVR